MKSWSCASPLPALKSRRTKCLPAPSFNAWWTSSWKLPKPRQSLFVELKTRSRSHTFTPGTMPPIMKSRSMTLLDVTILTAALVNFVFSLTVYLHSRRRLVETIFAVFALSVSLWSLATFLMTSRSVSFEVFKVGAKLHYISGNLVFWSLFWFSVFYPSRKNHSLFLPVALSTANAIVLILVLSTGFLFESFADTSVLAERIIFNTAGYVVLSLVTISMFGLSQLFLARKYLLAKGDERTQIGGIILATSIAGSLGLLSNLILPGFRNFAFFYLGPIIT